MSISDKLARGIALLLEQDETSAANELLDALIAKKAQASELDNLKQRTKKENFPSRLKSIAVSRRPEYQSAGVYQISLFYRDVSLYLNSLPAASRCQKRIRDHFNAGSKLSKEVWQWYQTRSHLSVAF
jgi:hypothetical protein